MLFYKTEIHENLFIYKYAQRYSSKKETASEDNLIRKCTDRIIYWRQVTMYWHWINESGLIISTMYFKKYWRKLKFSEFWNRTKELGRNRHRSCGYRSEACATSRKYLNRYGSTSIWDTINQSETMHPSVLFLGQGT